MTILNITKKAVVGTIKIANNGQAKAFDTLADKIDSRLSKLDQKILEKKKKEYGEHLKNISNKNSLLSNDIATFQNTIRNDIIEIQLLISTLDKSMFSSSKVFSSDKDLIDNGILNITFYSLRDKSNKEISNSYDKLIKNLNENKKKMINLLRERKKLENEIEKLNKSLENI